MNTSVDQYEQELQQAQEQINSNKRNLEQQRQQLAQEQSQILTPQKRSNTNLSFQSREQQRQFLEEQVPSAEKELNQYELETLNPAQAQVSSGTLQIKSYKEDQQAYDSALRMFLKRVPLQFVSGQPEYKYLKEFYAQNTASKTLPPALSGLLPEEIAAGMSIPSLHQNQNLNSVINNLARNSLLNQKPLITQRLIGQTNVPNVTSQVLVSNNKIDLNTFTNNNFLSNLLMSTKVSNNVAPGQVQYAIAQNKLPAGEKPIYDADNNIVGINSAYFKSSMSIENYTGELNRIVKESPILQTETYVPDKFLKFVANLVKAPVRGLTQERTYYTEPGTGKRITDLQQYLIKHNIPYEQEQTKPGMYSGEVMPVTTTDVAALLFPAARGFSAASIAEGASMFISEPVTKGINFGVDTILGPARNTGFGGGFGNIAGQFGRGLAYGLTTAIPGVGTAYLTELAKATYTDAPGTVSSVLTYIRKNPYEIGGMFAAGAAVERVKEVRAREKLLDIIDKNYVKALGEDSPEIRAFRTARAEAFGTGPLKKFVEQLPARVETTKPWDPSQLKAVRNNAGAIDIIKDVIKKFDPTIIGSSTLLPYLSLKTLRRGLQGDIDVQQVQGLINSQSKAMAEELYRRLSAAGYNVKFDIGTFAGSPKYHVTLDGMELLNAGTNARYFLRTQIGSLRGFFEPQYFGRTIVEKESGAVLGTLRDQLRIKLVQGFSKTVMKIDDLMELAKKGKLEGRQKDVLDVLDIIEGTKNLYKNGQFIGKTVPYTVLEAIRDLKQYVRLSTIERYYLAKDNIITSMTKRFTILKKFMIDTISDLKTTKNIIQKESLNILSNKKGTFNPTSDFNLITKKSNIELQNTKEIKVTAENDVSNYLFENKAKEEYSTGKKATIRSEYYPGSRTKMGNYLIKLPSNKYPTPKVVPAKYPIPRTQGRYPTPKVTPGKYNIQKPSPYFPLIPGTPYPVTPQRPRIPIKKNEERQTLDSFLIKKKQYKQVQRAKPYKKEQTETQRVFGLLPGKTPIYKLTGFELSR